MLAILPLTAKSQISRLGQDIYYDGTITGAFSNGDYAPFWFTSIKTTMATYVVPSIEMP